MLFANNVRQLNLAAKSLMKCMAEKGTTLTHSEALEMASRLVGYPSYQAARAAMEQPKGTPASVTTWRTLAHALGTLSDAQLDMSVTLTEGCDENGNAVFSQEVLLLRADDRSMAAGTCAFDPQQPLLVFTLDQEQEQDDAE